MSWSWSFFGRGRGRIRWFKKVLVVILCYISNIKLQMDSMSRDHVLQGRDQDQKLRNNLLYRRLGGLVLVTPQPGNRFVSFVRAMRSCVWA